MLRAVTGPGQIVLHNVRTDVEAIKHISTLMKSPEINILQGDKPKGSDEETRSLSFLKNSPDDSPTIIQKGNGGIDIKIDHVDNYNKPYNGRVETQFITYLDVIQITNGNGSKIPPESENFWFSKLISKKPGDISEYAKEHGIEVPWRKVIVSTHSSITAIAIVAVMVVVIALSRYKILKFNRE